ncbi:MAG: alpha-mannosidase [Chloroflexota bacterium]
MTKRRVHYVLSTHWDREWYQAFQHFRYRLVQLLDEVIAGLEDGRLKGPFTTDGQTIMLEDYLEVRPEREDLVRQLLREGKLVAGPWYVMPDEFLVSGESLVRNLRMGRDLVRQMGGTPSDAGFGCDLFGHNSQLPQILKGFGIEAAFIWRGVNYNATRNFIWRGADGSEIPCYRFGHIGYSTYAGDVRHAFEPHFVFDAEQAAADLEAFLQKQLEETEVGPVLLFDGGDHQAWDQDVYGVLLERMAQEDEEIEIVHGTLDAYMEELLDEVERIEGLVEGELREPGRDPEPADSQWLIPGVLSSRVGIKQANAACQALLCHWAEPLSAMASDLVGAEYPQGFLNVAWRWLLKNHPHDSICGCSIDQVHRDMRFRFSQCRQIGERLRIEACRGLAANVEGEVADDEMRVTVFNPLPVAHEGVATLTLEIPEEWSTFDEFFGFEPKPAFGIYDVEGEEIAYQRMEQATGQIKKRLNPVRFPETYHTNDVTVSLPLDVPALGYTTLTVRAPEDDAFTRHPSAVGLTTTERSMENEHLAVVVEANGTLTVHDKENDETYRRLLTFESCADIGDGWFHGQAVNDEAYLSTGSPAEVALVENGSMLSSLRVRTRMQVPAEFDFSDMRRADEMATLSLDSLITLRKGADWIEVETTVDNVVKDHRLRVLFPSGSGAQSYLADSPYDVVERPIALRSDRHLYRELEVETKPQQHWTAVHDAQRGLAVVSDGLLETAVRDLPQRPIALTLLRATGRTVMTDGEPDGQLQGRHTFRYWLLPLGERVNRTRLCYLGQRLAAGLYTAQLQPEDMALQRDEGDLPSSASYLALEGRAVVTSVRQVDGALEVRMFNPLEEEIEAELTLDASYDRLQWVNLESASVEEVQPLVGDHLAVTLGGKEIATLRFS